jgi:hypothetical protein
MGCEQAAAREACQGRKENGKAEAQIWLSCIDSISFAFLPASWSDASLSSPEMFALPKVNPLSFVGCHNRLAVEAGAQGEGKIGLNGSAQEVVWSKN